MYAQHSVLYSRTDMIHCPNCSSPADEEPIRCPRCGYRSEMAREYFWLYAGGAGFVLLGLAAGAMGVAMNEAGPGHWSRLLSGWFPLVPWPDGHDWMAPLVLGIVLTLCGLGITRRKPAAWFFLSMTIIYEASLAALVLAGRLGTPGSRGLAGAILAALATLLALALRIGAAYLRTPPRRIPIDKAGP